ncbi:UDP-N-acetylmuramoyl-L-alanyl-D-glutamate--2,6-diaminopimelate ligase [Paenibacillaceae bacterium WGS1546]|uniref:UDP-N-acetylmuramoyl-L-alanyl-D-glutamate--2, 6-diaminopimelate ligase n=1 Tax=Cohnella sp. WGS1546 TaxID=3366810 RepID=UPI00372D6011
MKLSSVVAELEFTLLQGDMQVEITSIAFDSREVADGGIFVAIAGFKLDGHAYIRQAIERGAAAVVVESDVSVKDGITVLKVANSRDALARMSATFYDNPTAAMNLIGVTGTNGKTSITYFIRSILQAADESVGLIGSTGSFIGDAAVNTRNTTPESLHLQQLFFKMREEGIRNCVMEVSSHALSLKRTAYCRFRCGIFTNLTPDHLELHQSMESYFEVKAELFDMTEVANIVNGDDDYGRLLLERLQVRPTRLISYGIRHWNDVYATRMDYRENGTRFLAHTPAGVFPVEVHFPGMIYVYNALAAIAFGISQGIDVRAIRRGLDNVKSIRGRMETVYENGDSKVIVDFAHTEDGLEKLLLTLRPFVRGRIILVFGVYGAEGMHGERKRVAMGKAAGTYADLSVVTSDNPKHQNPADIIHEIERGVQEAGGAYRSFIDRKEAIHYALGRCTKGDIVVIAGKGHETTQILGATEIPFDEREIVHAYMAAKDHVDI